MVVQKTRTGPDSLVEPPSLCLLDGTIGKISKNKGKYRCLLEPFGDECSATGDQPGLYADFGHRSGMKSATKRGRMEHHARSRA
jgi:hypothetical protein